MNLNLALSPSQRADLTFNLDSSAKDSGWELVSWGLIGEFDMLVVCLRYEDNDPDEVEMMYWRVEPNTRTFLVKRVDLANGHDFALDAF